ncbi:MAG TPA: hypothetical protein VM686_03410 [Polyangiaceae bacterium]|nr:hypothetical protein [Polyangiaceae bacterium]
MKFKWIGAAFMVLVGSAAGCSGSDETKTTVEPQTRGQRGETCLARNDCQEGLACISGTCSRNDFDVAVSPMHCDIVECAEDQDCCGTKSLEAPSKCDNRDLTCLTPYIPECVQTTCTTNANCNGGTCGAGYCSSSLTTCTTAADCADLCVGGFCSLSGYSCTVPTQATDCIYSAQTCTNRTCNCANPAYDPADPICTDPDCIDVCNLRCREERCVQDNSCETNTECLPYGLTICEAGRCVECLEDEDCNDALGETCVANRCDTPCKQNEECPLFHICNPDSGECEEHGCTSDRECVLATAGGVVGSGEDARLSKCLPSELNPDISTCKIPCENDGSCGSEFEICDAGYCVFIGCESDEECRSFLGLADREPSDLMPYVPKAVCRE